MLLSVKSAQMREKNVRVERCKNNINSSHSVSCGLASELKNLPRLPMRLLNYEEYIVRACISST